MVRVGVSRESTYEGHGEEGGEDAGLLEDEGEDQTGGADHGVGTGHDGAERRVAVQGVEGGPSVFQLFSAGGVVQTALTTYLVEKIFLFVLVLVHLIIFYRCCPASIYSIYSSSPNS